MAKIKETYQAIILIGLLFGGLLILLSMGEQDGGISSVNGERLEIGHTAPDFTFPDLAGNRLTLSDYRGRVTLVNIWATWCPPCVKEMPSMEILYQEFTRDEFEILAVSIDVQGDKAVAPFMQKKELTFPALLDPDNSISAPYGITGVPESFIIDKEGILVRKVIGSIDWESPSVVSLIRDLVEQ